MNKTNTIFLAFANSETETLHTLRQEDEAIYDILSPLALKGNFIIHRDSKATTSTISKGIAQYRESVRLFLYSGHAGRDKLILEDQEANAAGIAHLLGQCPRLQLVFLNGCSTKGQVAELLKKGVPAVLATSVPIDDMKAMEFSRRFFTALRDQNHIRQAFELAKGELLTKHADINPQIHGNLSMWDEASADTSIWGLYVGENQKVLEWKLPGEVFQPRERKFTPNRLIFKSLVDAMSKHSKEFAKLKENEAYGVRASVGEKYDLLMAKLPHTIAGQLAKILAPPTIGSARSSKFAVLGLPRLRQLLVVYNTVMELLSVTMLAQLWELNSSDKELDVSPSDILEIQKFMQLSSKDRDSYHLSNLIAAVRAILDKNEIEHFMPELDSFAKNINESPQTTESLRYLEQLKSRVLDPNLEENEAIELCIEAEQKLAILLRHIGFLANYTLASVKNISVLKFRHMPQPRFEHHIVKLVQTGASDPSERTDVNDSLLASKSVLIYRDSDTGRKFLNLSPFILDANAFDPTAVISKLFLFQEYDENADAYVFKHIYKSEDPPLIIDDELIMDHFDYNMVKLQFEAFDNFLDDLTNNPS
jgi:hypothetical protein